MNSRQYGIYYTALFNPFDNPAFKRWVRKNNLTRESILEPFAGSNSIIGMLQDIGLAKTYTAYDLYPKADTVEKRDTLEDYPTGHAFCVTNPPWLYKSSAKRNNFYFPDTKYDDLYKLSLSLALQNNRYVAALVPASFAQAGIFHERLHSILMINKPLFKHTESPVCLALFGAEETKRIQCYNDNEYIGEYADLQSHLPQNNGQRFKFNAPIGALGLVAIDNNQGPSIHFCKGDQLGNYDIRCSSRSITRIDVPTTDALITQCNASLRGIRKKTHDIFFTTFKGLRADGKYRRRIPYSIANNIVAQCV